MKQKRRKASKSFALAPTGLLPELRELIQSARRSVARGVNTALVQLYWQIGARIRKDILANRRAEYGKEIFVTLSQELVADFDWAIRLRKIMFELTLGWSSMAIV